MAKYPHLPLFTDALIADTFHLDDAEFGRYVRLLIVAWRTPGTLIPNDPEWIAKRLGLSPLEYPSKIAPLILQYFTPCDGDAKLMQKRLRKEFERLEKLSHAGKIGSEARWNNTPSVENKGKRSMRSASDDDAISMTPIPIPKPIPTSNIPPTPQGGIEEVKVRPEKAEPVDFPDWMQREPQLIEAFAAFLQNRKDMKKPVKSAYAIARHIGTLTRLRDAGHDPLECVNLAIERGWQAFYAPDGSQRGGGGSQAIQRPSHARKMQEAAVGAVMDYQQRKGATHDEQPD